MSRPGFMAWLFTGMVLLNLMVAALLSHSLLESRKQHEALAISSVDNLARLLAHDISGVFLRIDLALQYIADEGERQLRQGRIDTRSMNGFIERQVTRLPEASHLRLVDAGGQLRFGTGLRDGAPVDLADREFFVALRTGPDAGLVVSQPIVSRTSGKWQMVLARRVDKPDGAFGGVVAGVIELEKFEERFSKLNIGAYGLINLYTDSMAMVVRYPAPDDLVPPIGKRIISKEFEAALKTDRSAGAFQARSPIDARDRTFSYRTIGEFPLYVLVGLSADDYLHHWGAEVRQGALLMGLFALLTAGFTLVMARSWQRSRAAEAQIAALAFHDPLTDLPNRRLIMDRLGHAQHVSARSGQYAALLFIDLDNFKTLNDTRGHETGDRLLKLVAQRLLACVRENDSVARLGGDEFVVLLEGLGEDAQDAAAHCEQLAGKILAALNQPYALGGQRHHSSPSIGITVFDGQNGASVEQLLKQADLAMYQSKAAGRNTLRFFDERMQTLITERVALISELGEALRRAELILHYQPQVDCDGCMIGAEALLRWQHPTRGLIGPDRFIHLAEESGLIVPIGYWVLECACRLLVDWADKPDTQTMTISVNVSTRQVQQDGFVERVRQVLAATGADPHKLRLELTESLLANDEKRLIAKMEALSQIGVGFALDDFGTGYSSLAYLKRLPLQQLKIDKSFVRDLMSDANDEAIAGMIVALAHSLDLPTIAEGVERQEQFERLIEIGCHAFQGNLFGQPMPLEQLEALVDS